MRTLAPIAWAIARAYRVRASGHEHPDGVALVRGRTEAAGLGDGPEVQDALTPVGDVRLTRVDLVLTFIRSESALLHLPDRGHVRVRWRTAASERRIDAAARFVCRPLSATTLGRRPARPAETHEASVPPRATRMVVSRPAERRGRPARGRQVR